MRMSLSEAQEVLKIATKRNLRMASTGPTSEGLADALGMSRSQVDDLLAEIRTGGSGISDEQAKRYGLIAGGLLAFGMLAFLISSLLGGRGAEQTASTAPSSAASVVAPAIPSFHGGFASAGGPVNSVSDGGRRSPLMATTSQEPAKFWSQTERIEQNTDTTPIERAMAGTGTARASGAH